MIKNNTVALMILTFVLNVVSFGKNLVIAYFYGTNTEYDVFVLAQFIPLLISGLIMGSLQGALIPIIISGKDKYGELEMLKIYKSISLLVALSVTVIAIAFSICSYQLLKAIPIGFEGEHFLLLVSLSSVLIFVLILNCIVVLLRNLYNAKHQFILPTFSTMFGYVASILYIAIDPGKDMYTLCFSLLFGTAVEAMIQIVFLRRSGIVLPKGYRFKNPDVKRALLLTIPLMLSATFGLASPMIGQILASNLYEGAVSSLNYAEKLDSMLRQIFIVTISNTMLSSFTTWVSRGDIKTLKEKVNDIFALYGMILLPLAVYIVHFSPYIVKLLFERGEFTSVSTRYTSSVWGIYSLGLFSFLCGMILARIYNALQDAKYQVLVSLIGLFTNIGSSLVFMKHYGHNGIALGTVLTSGVTTVLLYYFMTKKIGSILTRRTLIVLMKVFATNGLLFGLVYLLKRLFIPSGMLAEFIWIVISFMFLTAAASVLYKWLGLNPTLATRRVWSERLRREA
ncbi:murein biosynthesis integral membrane protein MurJ [Paenibacillus flagellatus]|uniref:murein biosynthesis integral membrane protein MurJ n=1 Tax=Paenibacillus flagellatus TaxID=2211139 RepID=UPI0013051FD1|nr:lipid II flippase MurJ [Paenibacillus flagellatus]